MKITPFFACLLALMLIASAASPHVAAHEKRLPRIGIILYTDADLANPMLRQGATRAFADRGLIEGRTANFLWKSVEAHPQSTAGVVEELVKMPVDVLVVSGNNLAAEAARRAPTLPIVLANSDFPVENKLVASYARPGGNITGFTTWADQAIDAKRLALLKEAVPTLKRVAIFSYWQRLERPFAPSMQAGADALGLKIFKVAVLETTDLESAFATAIQSGADGVLVMDYPLAYGESHVRALSDLANKHRLPVMHSVYSAADAGGLLSYAIDQMAVLHKLATYVDKILRGTKPGDLPIEKLSKFELAVNLKAANAIGLVMPPSILVQATRVVE